MLGYTPSHLYNIRMVQLHFRNYVVSILQEGGNYKCTGYHGTIIYASLGCSVPFILFINSICGFKMAEQKDVCSLPLARAPESQLAAEQSSTGRHWNSPKKIPHSQIKGEATVRWQEGLNHNIITRKSNPITAGWVTHKLENNYTTEVHPLEQRRF